MDFDDRSYEAQAEHRALLSRMSYKQETEMRHEGLDRHCAPTPKTSVISQPHEDDHPFWRAAFGTAYKFGFGKTADEAVSNYYANNNTTDRFPRKGRKDLHS
jgi:hypothetical protein